MWSFRREERGHHVSTLEAVAQALSATVAYDAAAHEAVEWLMGAFAALNARQMRHIEQGREGDGPPPKGVKEGGPAPPESIARPELCREVDRFESEMEQLYRLRPKEDAKSNRGENKGAAVQPYALCHQRRTATGLSFYQLWGGGEAIMEGIYSDVQEQCRKMNQDRPKGQKITVLPWAALEPCAPPPPATPLL